MNIVKQIITLAETNNLSPRFRFFLINLSGLAIDLGVFGFLHSQDFSLSLVHIASFLIASGISFFLNSRWSFKNTLTENKAYRFLQFIIVTLLVLFLRGGILASLLQFFDSSPWLAIVICVFASFVSNCIGNAGYVFPQQTNYIQPEAKWYYFTIGIIIYTILLRLFYLGSPELFFEEAYYWNYTKHLDIGYLDHPPMVAWIIWLFTKLMGDIEFAVRFGAFTCWLIAAYFSYKLTSHIYGKPVAHRAILLIGILPFYFAVGLVMTPDAPLIACWLAALYFLYRALIDERRAAWLGVGITIGLGLLSKYTIILLGPAVLLFIFIDRHSRKWLLKPEPYLAAIIAVILFSPVILWNAEHEWASFAYQGSSRLAGHSNFSLPELIGSIIFLITPTGFLSVIVILLYKKAFLSKHASLSVNGTERGYKLLITLTLFPVAVFTGLSLFREIKFHWTGPCWLGIVPCVAVVVMHNVRLSTHKLFEFNQRAWPATIIICLLCYGTFLHYLELGFPGIPYPQRFHLLGWEGFGREIEAVVNEFEHDTGEKLLVVGMDRNRIASGLAFYWTKTIERSTDAVTQDPILQTSGPHLFGMNSLMYKYWFPSKDQNNKSMLLISSNISTLTSDNVRLHVQHVGDIKEIKIFKNGKQAGHYYYCLVRGYQSEIPAGNAPEIQTID